MPQFDGAGPYWGGGPQSGFRRGLPYRSPYRANIADTVQDRKPLYLLAGGALLAGILILLRRR